MFALSSTIFVLMRRWMSRDLPQTCIKAWYSATSHSSRIELELRQFAIGLGNSPLKTLVIYCASASVLISRLELAKIRPIRLAWVLSFSLAPLHTPDFR